MKHAILIILTVFTLISCTPSSEDLQAKIVNIENSIPEKINSKEDLQSKIDLLAVYKDFLEYYPEDTIAQAYYYKAGNLAMDLNQSAVAILFFQQYLKQEKDEKKIAEVMFYIGFMYENQVFDIENAEIYYNELLNKYPKSEYAENAKTALKDLGKFPEELIEEFSSKNANESDTAAITDSIQ